MPHFLPDCCRAGLAAAIVPLFLLGCRDEARVPTAPDRVVASTFADGDGLDEQIDPGDSHLVADVVITGSDSIVSEEPIENPVTGEIGTAHSVPLEAEQVRLHSGFTTTGQSVTTTYYAQEPDTALREPDDIVRSRIVDNVATDYTAANVPVYETAEESAEGADPLTSLPAYSSMTMLSAFEYKNEGGDTGPDCYADPDACAGGGGNMDQGLRLAADATTSRHVRTVRRPDPQTIEIETRSEVVANNPRAGRWARAGGRPGEVRMTQRYRRGPDGRFMLAQSDVEGFQIEGTTQRWIRRSMAYTVRRYFRNASRDAARRKVIREAPLTTEVPTFVRMAGETSSDGTASVMMIPPSSAGSLVPASDSTDEPGYPSTQRSIVFVHGGISTSRTWNRLRREWFESMSVASSFGPRVRTTTSWDAGFYEQRDTLVARLLRWDAREPLLVGHSNGGIVSRLTADSLKRRGRQVLGVITINTPHAGVPVVAKIPELTRIVTAAMKRFHTACKTMGRRGCGTANAMMDGDGLLAQYMQIPSTRMAQDVVPNSPFMAQLAQRGAQETFNTMTIVSRPVPHWVWMRIYGDQRCNPEENCGGRRRYSSTKRLVKHLKKAALIAGAVSGASYFAALATGGGMSLAFATVSALSGGLTIDGWTLYGALKVVDQTFNRLVAPTGTGEYHDGLVPVSSQRYSRAVEQFVIEQADSHVGSPKSDKVRDRLEVVIDRMLRRGPR